MQNLPQKTYWRIMSGWGKTAVKRNQEMYDEAFHYKRDTDYFALSTNNLIISNNGMTVGLAVNDNISTFGTYIANCTNSKSYIFKWTFEIVKVSLEVGIGLIDANKMHLFQGQTHFHFQEGTRYAYTSEGRLHNNKSSGDWNNNEYQAGDIIKMELNNTKKTISFYKNNILIYMMKKIKSLQYKLA